MCFRFRYLKKLNDKQTLFTTWTINKISLSHAHSKRQKFFRKAHSIKSSFCVFALIIILFFHRRICLIPWRREKWLMRRSASFSSFWPFCSNLPDSRIPTQSQSFSASEAAAFRIRLRDSRRRWSGFRPSESRNLDRPSCKPCEWCCTWSILWSEFCGHR